jgi:hypothetical protein
MIIETLALLIFDRNLIPMPFPVITRILSISVSLPVLDITGFFFCIRTQVTTLVLRTSAFT